MVLRTKGGSGWAFRKSRVGDTDADLNGYVQAARGKMAPTFVCCGEHLRIVGIDFDTESEGMEDSAKRQSAVVEERIRRLDGGVRSVQL